jgi:hypothetical protein
VHGCRGGIHAVRPIAARLALTGQDLEDLRAARHARAG